MITLLTDFGLKDHYVGVMKGVILSICPSAQIVDISHEITPYAIVEAAFMLGQCWREFPEGTIHVTVVDPGVGSARRPVLARKSGHYFVGPDNGIFSFVQPDEFRHLTAEQYFRHPVSKTFHGRDIFSPVAAHVQAGVGSDKMGEVIADAVVLQDLLPVSTGTNSWRGIVLSVDRFGNCTTNFDANQYSLNESSHFELCIGSNIIASYHANYASGKSDTPLVTRGSSGYLEVALNQGHAGRHLQIVVGDPIDLTLDYP
jgi:S-adenosylmethionine hydrolase